MMATQDGPLEREELVPPADASCGAGQHSVPQHTSVPVLQLQVNVFGLEPSLNCT